MTFKEHGLHGKNTEKHKFLIKKNKVVLIRGASVQSMF